MAVEGIKEEEEASFDLIEENMGGDESKLPMPQQEQQHKKKRKYVLHVFYCCNMYVICVLVALYMHIVYSIY